MKNIIIRISPKPVSGHYLKQIKQNRLVFAQTTNITIFIISKLQGLNNDSFQNRIKPGLIV